MIALTHRAATLIVTLCLASASLSAGTPSPAPIEAPAGQYVLEKTHASLLWRVQHMGLSNYTARFKRFDVNLRFDPDNFSNSAVHASVDITSLETDLTTPDGRDFNAELRSEHFFNTPKFPRAIFSSTRITPTGPRSMQVQGELELLGRKQPITLEVVLNGAMKSHPFAKVPALGFSARGRLERMAFGLNPPPIREGVGKEVELIVEAEFLQQP